MDKKEIEQLRDSIKQKLENAEFEGRIKIDKDVLEQLLFDSYIVDLIDNSVEIDMEHKRTMLIPIWSGKFLQKIDLSEVDFTDVYWGQDYEEPNHNIYIDRGICDYSNTNANIDLSKAFLFPGISRKIYDSEKDEFVYIGPKDRDILIINNCSFKNVDLSKSNVDGKILSIYNVDFENTNIKFNNTNMNPKYRRSVGSIENCNMGNTDLSNLTVPFLPMMDPLLGGSGGQAFTFNSCTNSGLKIVCNEEWLMDKYDDTDVFSYAKYLFDDFTTSKEVENFFECMRDFLDKYDFVGCYFNGTLIESKEQLLELSTNTMKKLIDDYKKTTTEYKMSQLLKSIDEQIDSKKKQDLNDMLSDKVEMIESSIDEQIKSKQ